MATITGPRTTLNIEQSQRRIDIATKIMLLEPDSQPLTVFSNQAGKERAISPEFAWLEDALDPRFDVTTGAATNVATAIPVANPSYFAQHDIVQVTRTGELMRVTSVAAPNINVVRAISSGTGQAINSGDELLLQSSAQPEGDTSKPARSANPVKVRNYTQIFRDPVEATETELASTMIHNPHDWDHQTRKKGIEHQKSKEYAFLFGKPSEDNTGSTPRRTTGGALYFIVTNQTDAGGTLTEAEWNGALRQGFRYGSRRKLVLASSLVVSVLNTYPAGKLQVRQDEGTYGVAVSRFVSPFGTVNLVTHWLLEGSKYGGYAVGIDMEDVAYRYLANDKKNRDTKLLLDRQANDADTEKAEYLTECGLQFGEEKKHFVVTGVTG